MYTSYPLSTLQWDYPAAHIIEHTATSDEADGHINNSVYLNWLDQCVWDHCTAVRARSDYICTNLTDGRPARMPDIFKACFAVASSLDPLLPKI